jgi:hypothetical protein
MSSKLGLLLWKVSNFLSPVKDALGLTPGMYSIPCKYGKVYIGQSGHSIKINIEEHHWHM